MIHTEHFTFNSFQTRCSVVWDESGVCAFVDPGCASAAELSRLTAFIASRGLRPAAILLTHAHFDHIYGVDALVREYGIPVHMHPDEAFTLRNTNPYVCRMYGLPEPETAFAAGLEEGPGSGKAEGTECGPVMVTEGDIIKVGTLRFEVIETPGHTTGGLCFFERAHGLLFSGDTLFAGAIGRTDHPGGDYDQLMRSIFRKLLPLDAASAAAADNAAQASPSDASSGPVPSGPAAASDSATASVDSAAASVAGPRNITVVPGHGPCTDLAKEGMTNPFLMPFNEPYDE